MIVEILENTCTLKYSIHVYCMFKDTPPLSKKNFKKKITNLNSICILYKKNIKLKHIG